MYYTVGRTEDINLNIIFRYQFGDAEKLLYANQRNRHQLFKVFCERKAFHSSTMCGLLVMLVNKTNRGKQELTT